MIDVVQALELLEICADEAAREEAHGSCDSGGAGGRRMSLTTRALAKRQLNVAHIARFSLRARTLEPTTPYQPTMTLGALIVFRTADKFGRAGASTARTLDAVYRAVQRYAETVPSALQDGADRAAIRMLIGHSATTDLMSSPDDLGVFARAASG